MDNPVEFYFHSGQNLKAAQALLLGQGEVAHLLNPDMSRGGMVGVGNTFVATGSVASTIHTLLCSQTGYLWIGAGGSFYQANSSGGSIQTVSSAMTSGARVCCVDQNYWGYMGDGTLKKKFLVSSPTTTYDWGIANPTVAPTVSVSGGNVACYYSWVAKYSDGSEYETDLSPVAYSTQAGGTIAWSAIAVSTTTDVTHKRLYRTFSGATYRVAEITNATTTYTDTTTDNDLVNGQVFARDSYYVPPSGIWAALEHYQRIFVLVTGDDSNKMFCSEPLEPQGFLMNSDTGLYEYESPVFTKGDDIMGMAVFGADLFFASRSSWKRLVGSSPTYWSLRPTIANAGNIAKHALQVIPQGILHVWWDGVYLFNGYQTQKITGKCDEFFKNVNWDYADTISSSYDGYQYRLFVPYGSSTTPNYAFVIDFSEAPARFWEESDSIRCSAFSARDNTLWMSSGSSYGKMTGTAVKSFELISRMIPTADLITISGPSELHYEIDTGGQDVTLTLYYDNTAHSSTITLNTSSRTRSYVVVPFVDSRTFHFKLSGSISSSVKIYEPWIVK